MIYRLLCLYSFFVPLELILKIFLGIDTIFKPYRVIALITIGIYVLHQLRGIQVGKDLKEDLFLYAIFAYGIFISLVQMLVTSFSLGKFYNDLFQMGIYLATFFIIKNIPLTSKQLVSIFRFFIIGIVCNVIFAFNRFFFIGKAGRQEGFMDNPNYLSLATIVLIAFIIMSFKHVRPWLKVSYFALVPITLLIFIASGSRTGFLVAVAIFLVLFLIQNTTKKILLTIGGSIILFLTLQMYSGEWSIVGAPLILVQRLNNTEVEENPRLTLWKGAIRSAEQTNFAGLGIGQFKARFAEFYRGERNRVVREVIDFDSHLTPHSDYFAILATYGIFGLICYLLFLFFSMKKLLLKAQFADTAWLRHIHQFQIITLVSLIVFGLAADSFNNAMYWLLLAVATRGNFDFVNTQVTKEL